MYFESCNDLNELKAAYKKLALKHHPDMGGDVRTMQTINMEYDRVFAILKSKQNRAAQNPDSETKKTTETADEFRAVVDALLKIADIEIELCGSWLWISGETYPNREALKAARCAYSKSKKKWYWHHPEDGCGWSRDRKTMTEIRAKYGSELIGRSPEREKLPA